MKFFQGSQYNVAISEDVVERISAYRQIKSYSRESGGILLGQVKGNCLFILKISEPSSEDTSTRHSFVRNPQKAQKIINDEFVASGKKTIYLGEWHTHPEDYPKPSMVDYQMIRDQFDKNELNEDLVLILIQGRKGIYLGLYCGVKVDQLEQRQS